MPIERGTSPAPWRTTPPSARSFPAPPFHPDDDPAHHKHGHQPLHVPVSIILQRRVAERPGKKVKPRQEICEPDEQNCHRKRDAKGLPARHDRESDEEDRSDASCGSGDQSKEQQDEKPALSVTSWANWRTDPHNWQKDRRRGGWRRERDTPQLDP